MARGAVPGARRDRLRRPSSDLLPALQATRVEPVRTIRGEVAGDARPGRARNFLIGLQVSASALLLIASAVFLRSALASSTVDPGMRTSDTVIIEIVNEPKRAAMVEAVTADPVVAAVAASWPDALGRPRGAFAETSGCEGEGRLQVRVAGVLRRARHPGGARPRIHAGGGRREAAGCDRLRNHRARTVAKR